MDFSKKRYLELIKESNKLRQEGKFLYDYDKAKYDELSQYVTLLNDDIVWESRKEYLQIIKLFISRRISIDEFIQQYGHLRRSNFEALKRRQKNLEDLPNESDIDFQLNPQSVGFTEIIGSIYASIDLFDPDITLDMNFMHPELIGYGISEEFLRLDLKDNFLPRIRAYCKES